MKVVENSPQNAQICTIFKNFLGGPCPQTPLAKARSFAARDMPLRGMYIQNHTNFKVGSPPLEKSCIRPWDTGHMKLAEGCEDMTWGSGLSFNLTITTKSTYWPGSNKLVSILESLRAKLRSSEVELNGSSSKETPVAVPDIASPASRSRSVNKAGSLRKSSQKVTPSTPRLKKSGRPLYKVFMKNRVSKRRKRQLTGSSNSAQDVDTGGSGMDTESESSFVSTRDHVSEPPNDLRDFDS